MIFKHFLGDRDVQDLERAKKVCDYILESLEPCLDKDTVIYIVDPYLDIEREIFEPFTSQEIDDSPWSYLLGYIIDNSKPKEVLVLTGWNLNELRNRIPKDNDKVPLPIEHGSGTHCALLISKLIKGQGSKSPDELHDRFILVDGHCQKGFHIGPSLTNLERKDCTVTLFHDDDIKEVIHRTKEIWDISLTIR